MTAPVLPACRQLDALQPGTHLLEMDGIALCCQFEYGADEDRPRRLSETTRLAEVTTTK